MKRSNEFQWKKFAADLPLILNIFDLNFIQRSTHLFVIPLLILHYYGWKIQNTFYFFFGH